MCNYSEQYHRMIELITKVKLLRPVVASGVYRSCRYRSTNAPTRFLITGGRGQLGLDLADKLRQTSPFLVRFLDWHFSKKILLKGRYPNFEMKMVRGTLKV